MAVARSLLGAGAAADAPRDDRVTPLAAVAAAAAAAGQDTSQSIAAQSRAARAALELGRLLLTPSLNP